MDSIIRIFPIPNFTNSLFLRSLSIPGKYFRIIKLFFFYTPFQMKATAYVYIFLSYVFFSILPPNPNRSIKYALKEKFQVKLKNNSQKFQNYTY